MNVGTATVKIIPELDEDALEAIAQRIEKRLARALQLGTR